MGIEIRQMVVNATVDEEQDKGDVQTSAISHADLEALKKEILPLCRALVYELLREEKER